MKRLILIHILFLYFLNGKAQVGGNAVYKFVDLTNSARVASLGGNNISISDGDLNFVYHNPSLLDSTMDNQLILNYVLYFAGINYGFVGCARKIGKKGNIMAGIHYINYGKFTEADESGNILGEFRSSEYAFNLVYSRPIIDSAFSLGLNIKPVLSVLEKYTSFGILSDAGITYNKKSKNITIALVIKNLGTQIKPYFNGIYEPVPFDIQAGITKKAEHAPFRISLLLHHLYRWDLTYINNQNSSGSISLNEPKSKDRTMEFVDKSLRHVILGLEFLPVKSFYFNLGFNDQRRQEMKLETKSGFTGFSWGFGINASKYRISYGRSRFHMAGASNHFSLTLNLDKIYQTK
jgi:hypothetical protein